MNDANSEAVMMIIVMPTMFVISGWAFKVFLNFIQQRDPVVWEPGSLPEAIEYLHSDAGEKLFAMASAERANPYSRILSALQAGAVLSLLSIGFIFLRGMVADGAEAFTIVGVLGLCLGLGFLASSAAAYVFSKNWGLLDKPAERDA